MSSSAFARMSEMFFLLLLALASSFATPSIADQSFDVRRHLSSVSSYGAVKDIVDEGFVPTKIPDGCKPIHVNLVARHGTRSPTKKRMRELERLGDSLHMLTENAEKNKASAKIPAWLYGWRSPWEGKTKGGDLLRKGEEEHYELAFRIKRRFAELFSDEYNPDVYSIKATQVPRASASAVAFGMGLFKGNGTLGKEGYRAFSVSTESRASDLLLRFFDTCQNYKQYKKGQEPTVEKVKEPIFSEIADSLSRRYGLNLTGQHVSSLWFLCKQEASLLDITDQACELFTPNEVLLLEWTDDVEMFVLKGYGNSVNYDMGVPLLNDVYESMELAIKANEEAAPSGTFEKARLRFAHAETILPFSCLLGLFLEGPDFQQVQGKQPLELPPKPPHRRTWRGGRVAPFTGNNLLVLYKCPAKTSSDYFVHILHNEQPIPVPGCNNSDFCPFDVFKEKIVMPQLKNDYNSVCNGNTAKKPQAVSEPIQSSFLSRWLPWTAKAETNAAKNEL